MVEATVGDILEAKGSEVHSIPADAAVSAAVAALDEGRVGALVVSRHGDDLVGIVSERDIVRGLSDSGAAVLDQPVAAIMTGSVETCVPGDTIADVMSRMTEGRFRHVPVIAEGALAGIISIGDVVKQRVDELELEARQLLEFIRAR